jgi:hypothetical protein
MFGTAVGQVTNVSNAVTPLTTLGFIEAALQIQSPSRVEGLLDRISQRAANFVFREAQDDGGGYVLWLEDFSFSPP